MTIYSLDVLLFLFGTSLLFHVWFCCFLTCIQISLEPGKVYQYISHGPAFLLKACANLEKLPITYSVQDSHSCVPCLPPQFSAVTQSCLTLCDPMGTPGFPVRHQLLELAQTHVCLVGDAIQPSRSLSSPSPAFYLAQHQGLFQ